MGGVYESLPGAAPDEEFELGTLAQLCVGNEGRLLDARRTPVRVRAIVEPTGMFEVEVVGFEDAGARWQLPFEDVVRFQFARGSPRASAQDVARWEKLSAHLDKILVVEPSGEARQQTVRAIAAEREAIAAALAEAGVPGSLDPARAIKDRSGEPSLMAFVEDWLDQRGLLEIEDRFVRSYVSNPGAGEIVKGHLIVAAELGLGRYRGKAPRDPQLFSGTWSKRRRSDHLIARIALTSELWSRHAGATVTLWRGAATEASFQRESESPLTSMTFSAEVAQSHFAGGPTTKAALLLRQEVKTAQLLMTFWETRGMNSPYREAEAVVFGLGQTRF